MNVENEPPQMAVGSLGAALASTRENCVFDPGWWFYNLQGGCLQSLEALSVTFPSWLPYRNL